jgi:ABC-type antimicrobial peptide transport system permease subunit
MDVAIVGSAIALGVTFLVIAVLAIRSRLVFKIALRNFLKRKRSTVMALFGLAVGAAIVTGSLSVGDSLENAVVQSAYQNLGNVDEAVRSVGLFNQTIADDVRDELLGDEIDAVAPLLILPVSVQNLNSNARESRVNIIGFSDEFLDFGRFKLDDGSYFERALSPSEALVNKKLAERIDASVSDILNVSLRTPEFSFESVYSPVTSVLSPDFEVAGILDNSDLGRFQLSSRGVVPENIFVRLDTLQLILNATGKVNTVVVSNIGDAYKGLEKSSTVTPELERIFDGQIGHEDLGFEVTPDGYVKIDKREIFFEERYLDLVTNITSTSAMVEEVSPLTSYFVNWIGNGTGWVAYSVVTGFDPSVDSAFGLFERISTGEPIVGEIDDDEAIITHYTANRLGIGEGSTITLNFSIYDDTFDELLVYENFTVKYVVNMTGKALDSELMPSFPGIEGRESCGDWDPPIPIDFSIMVGEDLDYWQTFGGSPKAYITLDKAKELWANDLGEITTIKIQPTSGTNVTVLSQWVGSELNESFGYRDAGITISQIKKEAIDSAEGIQIVTETFVAFGAVVILAGMLLIIMIVATSAEERKREIGIIRTLGATRRKTTLTFAFEGSILAIIASAIGTVLGIVVAIVCVWLTNTFWSNIVEGNQVALAVSPSSILIGLASGFLIALITFSLSSYIISRMRIVEALRGILTKALKKSRGIAPILLIVLGIVLVVAGFFVQQDPSILGTLWLLGPTLAFTGIGFLIKAKYDTKKGTGIAAAVSIAYTLAFDVVYLTFFKDPPFLLFFLSGFIVVLSASLGLWSIIGWMAGLFGRTSVAKVAFSNPSKKAGRSTLMIAMFGLVIFTLVALAVNISGQQANIDRAVSEQSGGYQVMAEATTPLRFDLGDNESRTDNGITGFPTRTSVVQFSTFGAPGGTCSNLNSELPPRLIGANGTFLGENTLQFSSSLRHGSSDAQGAWSELDEVHSEGSIPIIGDTNTIVWIYEKGVGDTIEITDENGQERKLVVTGILQSSIFSGSVFLSEENLNDLFPTKAEYDLFLFKTDEPEGLVAYLEPNMASFGVDAILIEEKVREDLEVEWSYMSLFQTLLLFGLIVGTAGLALTSAKSVSERRNEIGILRSLGFTRDMVLWSFLLENLYISLSGVFLGVVFGLSVSFIFFGPIGGQGYGVVVPWVTIAVIVVAVFIATILSTAGPSIRAGRMETVKALRIEE